MNEDQSNYSSTSSTNTSMPHGYSKKIYNPNYKRPQVYSNYIQPNLQSNTKGSNDKFQKAASYSDIIKKPKLNQETTASKTSNLDNSMDNQINQCDPALMNYLNSFLGINTFESENLFLDLIENDLALICLDHETKSKKNNFCFKGRCSIALVYGKLNINGYELKANLNDSAKWFDLYSPETNSFLSISNKLNLNENLTAANLEQQQNVLINRIQFLTQIELSQFPEKNLRLFLRDFMSNTSSLFLLRGLKSKIQNYFGYFDNLKQIYKSYSSKESQSELENHIDIKLSHLGLYPVADYNFNAVFVETDDEREIVLEFANLNNQRADFWPVVMACGGKDVGKSTLLRFWTNALLN